MAEDSRKPISLLELKRAIDKAVEYAGVTAEYCDVEVHYKKKGYAVIGVGQFGVKADIFLEIGEKIFDFSDEEE